MAKISATASRVFQVEASLERVYRAFSDPEVIRQVMGDVERCEIEGARARYVLKERREKGTRFKPDYTVEYEGNGEDCVSWRGVAGNIDVDGGVSLREVGGGVEVDYRETLTPDLPIPRLMAKVFRPIVSNEVRKGIEAYLNNMIRHLSSSS